MNRVDISLYGILDPEHCRGRQLSVLVQESVQNGVTLVQYRDKSHDTRRMVENGKAIASVLKGTGVPLIINDRVDVALACGADGVHLGQQDMKAADARRLLGKRAVIGLSVKTIDEAKDCPVDALDYVFVGGVFETASKENPAAIGLDGWVERANIIKNLAPGLPVGAIAGIEADNVASLMNSDCHGVAVISAIYKADDVAAATRVLAENIRKFRS